MKKTIIFFMSFLTLLACSSNDNSLNINEETFIVKMTYQNMTTGLDRIKFEGLPILEQDNKWMPANKNIEYDANNDHINYFSHWQAENNSIKISSISIHNGENSFGLISDKYNLLDVIIPNPIINSYRVTSEQSTPILIKNGITVKFNDTYVDMEDYTQLDNFEDSFSFEIKVQLK
ncbi:hypothetical protein [uncultured Tenacibaculum sp.]|uniref:hypothetical protein n=1 Tax=uncultured Tenacibaculum sp. TaxID=174713 RepID=UPI002608CC5D|nr:hypothetical protein [uncultured Tenacibaculum sp.]